MTLSPLPIRRARQAATALHERLDLRDVHGLDIEAMAKRLGVRVRRGGLHGAAARLVGGPSFAIIRLSSRIEHEEAQRFSFAHEVGHWQLRHRSDDVPAPCKPIRIHEHVDRGIEAEANAFAAELLMPARLLRSRCEVSPVSLENVRAIAGDYRVSLVAAAVRFVELTSERCAAVFSRAGKVVWAARSETFVPFIDRGRRLGAESVAVDWFRHGRLSEGPQPVPADAWFDHDADADAEIWEDACAVPAGRGVLSLPSLPT